MSIKPALSDREIAAAMVEFGLAEDVGDPFVLGYELPRIRAIDRALRRHLAIPSPSVLDVGYLDGRVPFALRCMDSALVLSCSERDDATAQSAALRAQTLLPGVPIHTLDLTDIRATEPSYDAIILGEVLEHISAEHLPRIFNGLSGMLHQDGILVVTTPNLHSLSSRVRHALGADFLHDPVGHEQMGLPHVNLLSARLLCDLARNAGLEAVAVEFNDFTSGMRARRSRRARILQKVRAVTLSRVAASTRDDLLLVLRRSAVVRPPSDIFSRTDVSLREALRAARTALPATRR